MMGLRFPGLIRGLVATLAAMASGTISVLAYGSGEFPARFADVGPDWRSQSRGSMRLGLPADRWAAEEAPASGPRRVDRCKRWRAVAESLGETFAGYTLRKTVVRRNCEMFGPDDTTSRWDWPWNGIERGRIQPPRAHRVYGHWAIRCGTGVNRRRCALMHNAPPDDVTGGLAPRISTHFVIDRVAGREVLLWRLFVPATDATPPALLGLAGAGPGDTIQRAALGPGDMRFKLGPALPWEKFPVCSASGCLMEVSAERAGQAATHLADGLPLGLELRRAGAETLAISLPALGFAPALTELIRLRRAERRPDGVRESSR